MRGDFWTESSAALRYRDARPYFHPVVMDRVRRQLGLKPGEKLHHGLDVGCGTGQSSVSLLAVADSVTGIDSSVRMLEYAERGHGVEYLHGTAEQLPVANDSANIVTVSVAIHWFDVPAFLTEAARVLRPTGWLVSYSNTFRAQMVGNPEFYKWCGAVYGVRYPTPPRSHNDPPETMFAASPFDLVEVSGTMDHSADSEGRSESLGPPHRRKTVYAPEPYSNEVSLTPQQLVAYLMTHSNVVAKVEQGTETAAEVAEFLTAQVSPLFHSKTETFLFDGLITYARLKSAS